MSQLVDSDRIEAIVGTTRHEVDHYARAVSAEQTVYILHSRACLDTGRDLRDCPYSLALDEGIDAERWVEDVPTVVEIRQGRLVPSADE